LEKIAYIYRGMWIVEIKEKFSGLHL
jgi:hypothetical protein